MFKICQNANHVHVGGWEMTNHVPSFAMTFSNLLNSQFVVLKLPRCHWVRKPNVLLQSDQSTTFPQVALSDCSVHNACKHLRRYHRGSLSSACSQTWSVLHTLTYIDFLLKYSVQNLKEVIFVGENWVHLLIWFLLPCFRGLQCRLSHMHATLLIAPILLCLYNFGIS
jgi:hypothetical protein